MFVRTSSEPGLPQPPAAGRIFGPWSSQIAPPATAALGTVGGPAIVGPWNSSLVSPSGSGAGNVLPVWSASVQRVAAISADQGFTNLVSGSPFGSWVQTGGAVDLNAAAGPNGLPAFRLNAASGGWLQSSAPPFSANPNHVIALARVRTPVTFGTILNASTGLDNGIFLKDSTHYQAGVGGKFVSSGALDPTQWVLIDSYFGGTFDSALSINGGTRTVGDMFYIGLAGLKIGGAGPGSARMDVDIFSVEVWNGRIPYAQLLQYYAYLSSLTGLTFATPASYPDPNSPPLLTSRPSLWPADSSRTIFFGSWGQSNDVGHWNGTPIVAPSTAMLMFNLAMQVKAATTPLKDSASGVRYGASNDGAQHTGYQNRACNTIAASLGRNVTISVDSYTGSSSTQWLPNQSSGIEPPSSLFGAAVARAREAQYWGQEMGGIFVCQGEADSDGTAWLNNWRTIIARARSLLGMPRLPFFFTQTPSSAGVRTSESAIADPTNNVFFIPSVLGANMQGDQLHWNDVGYDTAGAAIASQFLSGYPYS